MNNVGRIVEGKIIKKSHKGDWYVLENSNFSRNIFLHISDWNKDPNLDEGDYLDVFISSNNIAKRRYSGSLKKRDLIYPIIEQVEILANLTGEEKKVLFSINYLEYFDKMDELKDYLHNTIINYRNAISAFENKDYERALQFFNVIKELSKSKHYIEIINLIQTYNEKENNEEISSSEIFQWLKQNKFKLKDYILNIDEIIKKHRQVILQEIETLIESELFNEARQKTFILSERVTIDVDARRLRSKIDELEKIKERSLKVADENGFYHLDDDELLADKRLEKYYKFYLMPYYEYKLTKPYSIERDNTSYILNIKSGEEYEVQLVTNTLHKILPNTDIVLCFVPSSTSNKKYFKKKWNDDFTGKIDSETPINPSLADIIYMLTSNKYSYNEELSKNTYKKIDFNSKRIDGSTVLKRKYSVTPAHEGGNRDIKIHLDSIIVENSNIIKGKDVWLLDDVASTGNSLHACHRLLINAGAKSVKWLVIGRTTKIQSSSDEEYEYLSYDDEDVPF